MLQQLRDKAKSFVSFTLLILLVLSFAIWGIGDIFRRTTSHEWVANTETGEIGIQSAGETAGQHARRRVRAQKIPDGHLRVALPDASEQNGNAGLARGDLSERRRLLLHGKADETLNLSTHGSRKQTPEGLSIVNRKS